MSIGALVLLFMVPLILQLGMVNIPILGFISCLMLPIALMLVIFQILFPILGAIQGSQGNFYRYPMLFRVIS